MVMGNYKNLRVLNYAILSIQIAKYTHLLLCNDIIDVSD